MRASPEAAPDPMTPPPQPPPPPPAAPRRRSRLHLALAVLLPALGTVVATAGLGWWWSGSEGSLNQTLQALAPEGWLTRALAAAGVPSQDMGRLQAEGVTGSLRQGGRIARLRWRQTDAASATALEADDVALRWQPAELLNGRLQIDTLAVKTLTLHRSPAATPTPPLQSLVLPLPIAVSFSADEVQVQGAGAVRLSGVRGHYAYGVEGSPDAIKGVADKPITAIHQLRLDALTLARGQYQGTVSVQANTPMALQANLSGQVSSQAPAGADVALTAQAKLTGQLSGAEAALDMTAHVRTQAQAATGRAGAPATTLDATARLLPWADQPVHSAEVSLGRVNLADFWPVAPATDLSGTVHARPDGAGWQARLALRNARPGPWDRQLLPVQSLDATVQQLSDRWAVPALSARLGDGTLQGQGEWRAGGAPAADGAAPWQGKIRFTSINPAALHGALARARLDGQAQARAQGAATAFEATITPGKGRDALPASLQGLTLGQAHAAGQWQGDTVTLRDLSVQAAQARLQGQGVLHLARRSFTGQANAGFPGGSASFKGAVQLANLQRTEGEIQASLTQAEAAWAWLKSLPGVPGLSPDWRGWGVQGRAELTASIAQTVKARLDLPSLVLQAPPDNRGMAPAPWRANALQLALEGPWPALAVEARGSLDHAPWRAMLDSRAVLDLTQLQQGQAIVSRVGVSVQDSARSLAWALQSAGQDGKGDKDSTAAPLTLRWKADAVELLPGSLRLVPQDLAGYNAPRNEAVTLAWQQLLWDAQGLRTQGRLSQLTLAWVDWLAGPQAQPLADLGLSGQMVFDGDWDVRWPADGRSAVRVNAGLQRSSGDLRLALDDGSPGLPAPAGATVPTAVAAGLREASWRVSTESLGDGGIALRSQLRWSSERAGTVNAEASTRLRADSQGWSWPADAALRGTLTAQLPQIGVWSLLAPPGWRMRGTMAAQATLEGTRAAPQWRGQLQADQLALRSVVDGIEFINGQLRATLAGDKVVIDRFALEGAGGAKAGGQLTASGSAQWALPPATAAARRVPHIDLQVALDRLRVSSRPDRRLVVSGQAQASLAGPRLQLRGKLRADQASFTLPDEFTPALGSDVVVRPRQAASASAVPAAPAKGQAAGQAVVPDVQLDLDLGTNFAVQGLGLKARLEGALQVRSSPDQAVPRLLGEVRATSGTYRAYGVNLALETGLLRFAGPYDNPSLDILAIRPNITQRVGVQVTGTAQLPVVRLYAEPELPDTEKLSWLVLGRSAAGPGGEAAILQQAALSLLGRPGNTLEGGLASKLGLDELSYRSGGVNADGSVSSAAVSLGKRLSSKLYVVYGQSLTSSVGTISILYELSRRLTLRAKAGEDNVLELIFTQRYD